METGKQIEHGYTKQLKELLNVECFMTSPGGGSTSSPRKGRTRRSQGCRGRRISADGSAQGKGENPPIENNFFKSLVILLITNPVDDNAKLFHQSLPVKKVVRSDQEIPEWFLSVRLKLETRKTNQERERNHGRLSIL